MAQTNANNKGASGMKAEERTISVGGSSHGGVASLGSYFQGISSYLPSSIKKQFYVSPPHFEEDKDVILGMSFDEYEDSDGCHKCLLISYTNGFQIWSLDGGMKELLSVREGPIKSIKFLPVPLGEELPTSPLFNKRPLLAVISAEESTKFPRSMVKLFSLKASEFVNAMRFRSPVYSIECNKRVLIVALRDSIYGFDLVSMERVLSLPCYPSPLNNAVLSLGQRWLAYASNQPILPTSTSPTAVPAGSASAAPAAPTLANVAKDVATDLAKEVAQGLYYLGDMGRKTVSNYLYPEEQSVIQPIAPQDYKDTEHAGTIIIYDIVLKKVLTHFRAHAQSLSAIKFDPTGTLLVTASVEGHNFNVFQICPPPPSLVNRDNYSEGPQSYRHLYKLVRGLTNATIQDISFSSDSKWMAVSSTRGTTHIYAINPQGGPVNINTHIPTVTPRADVLAAHRPDLPPTLVKLSVCSRIKHVTGVTKHEDGTMKVHHLQTNIGSTSFFVGASPLNEQLFVMSQSGLLTLYQLQPHPPPPSAEVDPSSLNLTVVPMSEWDVCRRPRWPECKLFPVSPREDVFAEVNGEIPDTSWLANVEILTHSPYIRPLWVVPQFTFKTFHPSQNLSSSPGSVHQPLATTSDINQALGKLNVNSTTNTNTNNTSLYPTLPSTSPPPKSSKKKKGKNANKDTNDNNNNATTTTTTATTTNTTINNNTNNNNNTTNATAVPGPNGDFSNVLFDEGNIPTKKIDIRRFEPMPFKENLDDSTLPFGMSPPHHAEEFVKEGLMAAISTPMVAVIPPRKSKLVDESEPRMSMSPPFAVNESYAPILSTTPDKPSMLQTLKPQQPTISPSTSPSTINPIRNNNTKNNATTQPQQQPQQQPQSQQQPQPTSNNSNNSNNKETKSKKDKKGNKQQNGAKADHNFGFEDLQFGQEEDEVL